MVFRRNDCVTAGRVSTMKAGTVRGWIVVLLLAMSARSIGGERCDPVVMLPENAFLPGCERSPGDDISERCWGEVIRALKPIRVLRSQANIAVVVEENAKGYSGFYFVTPESSYLPANAQGRTFTCDASRNLLRFRFQK